MKWGYRLHVLFSREVTLEYQDFSLVQIPITSLEEEVDLEYVLDFTYLPSIGQRTIE